jgi:cell wall-associated NlpC family hydrolase
MNRSLFLCLALALLIFAAGCATTTVSPPPPKHARHAQDSLVQTARSQIGAPYRYGACDPRSGFDCSGLVQWCYMQHGKKLPRRTEDLFHAGVPVRKDSLIPGDLVFFNISRWRGVLHVGIYSGRGKFIHSPSSGERVREENLADAYWMRTYYGARRVLLN